MSMAALKLRLSTTRPSTRSPCSPKQAKISSERAIYALINSFTSSWGGGVTIGIGIRLLTSCFFHGSIRGSSGVENWSIGQHEKIAGNRFLGIQTESNWTNAWVVSPIDRSGRSGAQRGAPKRSEKQRFVAELGLVASDLSRAGTSQPSGAVSMEATGYGSGDRARRHPQGLPSAAGAARRMHRRPKRGHTVLWES